MAENMDKLAGDTMVSIEFSVEDWCIIGAGCATFATERIAVADFNAAQILLSMAEKVFNIKEHAKKTDKGE